MKKITLKQNGTFEHLWIDAIHGASIPASAIDVTDAVFMELSQNHDKKYDPATKIVSDVVKTQAELDAIKEGEERGWRNAELSVVDIDILKAEDAGSDSASLRVYRQALRDYPQQADFPYGTRPLLS